VADPVAPARPASGRWRVLVVEADAEVVAVCRGVVEALRPLELAGVVSRAEDALALAGRDRCDLVLVGLPHAGTDGLNLVKRLRATAHRTEIIVLSDSGATAAVRAMVQWGAIDILLKPFSAERLREGLGLFLHRAAAVSETQLDQAGIDRICAAGRGARRAVPKGLSPEGVARVRDAVHTSSVPVSSAAVAATAGFAQVTARRYLEYLVATGQAEVEAVPSGRGRPRKLYRRLDPTRRPRVQR